MTSGALHAAERFVRHPVWAELSAPFLRTAAWWAESARAARRRHGEASVPHVAPDLGLAIQALVDEIVLSTIRWRHRPRSHEDMSRIEREARDAVALYRERGWLDAPATYHVAPSAPRDAAVRRTRAPGGPRYEILSFRSGYEPHADEPGRDRYLADEPNATAYAWLLRHKGAPRPWVVGVHGAGMGQAIGDLRIFRVQRLYEDLGCNVALPIQARHGPRRRGAPFGVGWPGDDMVDNVHAIAQSVWDIRRVIAWIRAQQPGVPIALHGLSLGGYTTALVAGLEDDLAAVIVGVPAIDFGDLMERHTTERFSSRAGYERIHELAHETLRVVSPLAIPPRLPLNRRFIYAGLADRLVHPRAQIHELWKHWEEPQIHWFRGSHVGFFLSRPVLSFVEDALRTAGVATV